MQFLRRLYVSALLLVLLAGNSAGQQRRAITIIIRDEKADPVKLYFQNRYDEDQIIAYVNNPDTVRVEGMAFLPLKISCYSKTIIHPLVEGDSLLITIRDKTIIVDRRTGSYKAFDTSLIKYYNSVLATDYKKLRLLTDSLYGNPNGAPFAVVRVSPKPNFRLYAAFIDQSARINRLEKGVLDSLFQLGRISDTYQMVYLSLFASRYLNDIVQCYSATKSAAYLDMIRKRQDLFDGRFLTYDAGGYKSTINNFIINIIEEGKARPAGKNTVTYDYVHAFDNVSRFVSGDLVNYIQFVCLKKIAEQNGGVVFRRYKEKYQASGDGYLHYFDNRNLSADHVTDQLLTLSGDTLSSQKAYDNGRNLRYYYVDIWATWCAPCVQNIDHFIDLKAALRQSPIGFIMLSIDENADNWRAFSMNRRFKQVDGSYLVLSPKTAELAQKINLTTIPRYLIIDASGNIVNPNAPAPDAPNVSSVLAGYLKKQSK